MTAGKQNPNLTERGSAMFVGMPLAATPRLRLDCVDALCEGSFEQNMRDVEETPLEVNYKYAAVRDRTPTKSLLWKLHHSLPSLAALARARARAFSATSPSSGGTRSSGAPSDGRPASSRSSP